MIDESDLQNIIISQLNLDCDKLSDDFLNKCLTRLPDFEADILYLYFVKNKKQKDIAHIFGCTQAAISYRIKKSLKRIEFLLSIPDVPEPQMREVLASVLDPLDVEIFVRLYQTTCQTSVADSLYISQGLVRHRFFKGLRTLDTEKNLRDPYLYIFNSLSKNFNILKEVSLPQWTRKNHLLVNVPSGKIFNIKEVEDQMVILEDGNDASYVGLPVSILSVEEHDSVSLMMKLRSISILFYMSFSSFHVS